MDLTLTSVVFEYAFYFTSTKNYFGFNFNKCCIWIAIPVTINIKANIDLTLTSVVFELNQLLYIACSILFNFNKCCIWMIS